MPLNVNCIPAGTFMVTLVVAIAVLVRLKLAEVSPDACGDRVRSSGNAIGGERRGNDP